MWGILHEESIAEPKPCGCASHDYIDFNERLQRLHPGLHLGFDLRKQRWVIYKWDSEIDRIPPSEGLPGLCYAQKILDIVMTCEVWYQVRGKDGGWRDKSRPIPFGDWVLIKIAKSATDRFVRGSGWIEREVKRIAEKNDADTQKSVRKNAEAWVNDCMSLADRGNPFFRRRQFRQRKKVPA